jgi:hypothetical protein
MRRVCVVGGGNIGLALCFYLHENPDLETVLFTSKPESFLGELSYVDKVSDQSRHFTVNSITSDLAKAVTGSEVVLITLPAFMRGQFIELAAQYLESTKYVIVIPGYGGSEFYARTLWKREIIFAGLDRVPCVSRLTTNKVIASKKMSVRCASLPSCHTQDVATLFAGLIAIECEALPNYLTVTLTPSNPIVHTARLYSLFKDYREGYCWNSNMPFYADWDDESSEMLLSCDAELHGICDRLSELDLSQVIPLATHYQASTVETLTKKIRGIKTMEHILSPMVSTENGFIPDRNSRYFLEDMPYGLSILKAFGLITQTETPYMDKILDWYGTFSGKHFFVAEQLGRDAQGCAIPQNFGISSKDDVYAFYK